MKRGLSQSDIQDLAGELKVIDKEGGDCDEKYQAMVYKIMNATRLAELPEQPKSPPKTIPVAARLPAKNYERLVVKAAKAGVSVADYIKPFLIEISSREDR